ncbi:MAG: DnaA regulatory inactivator Hda, partial [Thioalkalivibrio sp.]
FNLINAARLRGSCLVLADEASPRRLSVGLPDLASRLVWGPVFQLQTLDDVAKCAVLQERARRRGFDLPEDVGVFLLRTCSRDLASLMVQLERLEQASLREQRRVTLPFARVALGGESRMKGEG